MVTLAALCAVGCKSKAQPTALPADTALPAESAPQPAADPTTPAATTDLSAQITAPMLWRVTTAAGKTGWLFGTIHIGVDAERQLPAVVWEAFDTADIVCEEADTSKVSPKSLMRTDGKTLSAAIGAERWKKVTEIVPGPLTGQLDRMKAATAFALITILAMPKTPPMDSVIEAKAKRAGKEVVYLEQASFQLQLLDSIIDDELFGFLIDHIDELDFNATVRAYVAGDADALHAEMTDPKWWSDAEQANAQEALDAILYDRNADWIPKIEALFARGVPFCAVGAGHLIGAKSVVDLLRARGHKVERVPAAK